MHAIFSHVLSPTDICDKDAYHGKVYSLEFSTQHCKDNPNGREINCEYIHGLNERSTICFHCLLQVTSVNKQTISSILAVRMFTSSLQCITSIDSSSSGIRQCITSSGIRQSVTSIDSSFSGVRQSITSIYSPSSGIS